MVDFGPCGPWPVRWSCDISAESPTLTGMAVNSATSILWALSGRRYGLCTVTVRPCRQDCFNGLGPWSAWAGPWEGPWTDTVSSYPFSMWWLPTLCGSCSGSCSCTVLSEVLLPAPVSSVVSVMMDGTPMATGSYRLDDNRKLVRLDGAQWPYCNDLLKDDTHIGTWSVTAQYGEDVPDLGRLAVGELACEIIKAASGADCRIPIGVKELVRQGVTLQIPDFADYLKSGMTGLYLTDMFLSSVNPHRLQRRSKTYSVDRPAFRRAGS